MARILVCDDERDIVNALTIYLRGEGYEVLPAYTGREALEVLGREAVDLVLLDIMMPGMDGLTAMGEIRKVSNVPVILLTAKSEDMDKVLGLTVGADDYVTKPFVPMELLARVKSQLRRYLTLGGSAQTGSEVLSVGAVSLDDKAKSVTVDGEPVNLTPTEFEILKLLMRHPGEVFSPRRIYEEVWKDPAFDAENTVAVHIRHLREKIEIDPSHPRYLTVVWGHGYRMEAGPKR